MTLGDDHETSGGYGGTGHTRTTRLPDRAGDVYGGARRGRGSSRSLVTVVGVIVLLIAAIAFANRGDDDPGTTASSPGTGAGAQPEAGATAASGKKPVRSGFAQDEQGAQSAAANYAVRLGSTGMFNKDSRHSIVDALYTSTAAVKLQSAMDQAYSANFLSKLGLDANGTPPKGSTFVSRTIPVGTKVTQFSTGSAKVAVWYMGLIGMSGQASTDPVSSTWKTWTFDLRWVDGDWKITTDAQTDGPAPVPGDDKAASSDEISKAIEEYGGFTYAR